MADNNYEDLFNSEVVDIDGNKIGSIGQVYLDDQTGQPSWVTVKTGWFGLKETFVPLDRAEITSGQIKVPFSEEQVKEAPRVDPDKHLDADEEAELYEYYGIPTVASTEDVAVVPSADESQPGGEAAVAGRPLGADDDTAYEATGTPARSGDLDESQVVAAGTPSGGVAVVPAADADQPTTDRAVSDDTPMGLRTDADGELIDDQVTEAAGPGDRAERPTGTVETGADADSEAYADTAEPVFDESIDPQAAPVYDTELDPDAAPIVEDEVPSDQAPENQEPLDEHDRYNEVRGLNSQQ